MSRKSGFRPTKPTPTEHQKTQRLLAPENAMLAQGLLQIILDEAYIQAFSQNGGGVAVMRLERWQIDVLGGFGFYFEDCSSETSLFQQDDLVVASRFRPEYLSSLEDRLSIIQEKLGKYSMFGGDDILSSWLEQDNQEGAMATQSDAVR